MRIRDLLNDEDAPYQQPQRSPLPELDDQWIQADKFADGAAFPAFLLNAADFLKKTSRQQVVQLDHDDDDRSSDSEEEHKATSPPSVTIVLPPIECRSTMSIQDILTSAKPQQQERIAIASPVPVLHASPPPIDRLESFDSGYRSSISEQAVAVQPLHLNTVKTRVSKRKTHTLLDDLAAADRKRGTLCARRFYYKKASTLAQLRTLHQELKDEYRVAMNRQPTNSLQRKYQDLCRVQDELRGEVERMQRVVLDVGKLQDKLQWLVEDVERQSQGTVGPPIPDDCLAIEPLTQRQCQQLSARVIERCRMTNPAGGDELAFGWMSVPTAAFPWEVRLAKTVHGHSGGSLCAATWQRFCGGDREWTAAIFAARAVRVIKRVDAGHVVVHVAGHSWQAVLLCSRVLLEDTTAVITMQTVGGPTLGATSNKRWLANGELLGWMRFQRSQESASVDMMRSGRMIPACEIQSGVGLWQGVAPASSETRRLQVHLVAAMRRWEAAVHAM